MIKFIKQNKTLSICLIMTLFIFVLGILFNALLNDEIKKEIATNINNMISNLDKNPINLNLKIIFNDFFFIFIIWIFGISIIGIPINLFLYFFKVFMFSFEMISLLSCLHLNNILFIIIYMLSSFLSIIIYFILLYYSINYSLVLIKLIFLKKNYNIKTITQRYLKIFLITIICSLTISLLECFLIPKLLLLII